jgi:hypothetical protein
MLVAGSDIERHPIPDSAVWTRGHSIG